MRIYVNPDGLRVDGENHPYLMQPGGHWLDDPDALDPFLVPGGPESPPEVSQSEEIFERLDHLARAVRTIRERLDGEDQPTDHAAPVGMPYWQKPKEAFWGPLVRRLATPLPCLAVWAGMIGTFFWNSVRSLPDQPFGDLIEFDEGFPIRLIAAAGETAVFLVWTLCFRSTIRSAIRAEFQSSDK